MSSYATRMAFALGALICLLWKTNPLYGKEVLLEEVSISLHNKPVTGFRVVLDRSERFVANQIMAHVAAADNTPPFQYERSIIYENIRYAPIADDRDISLYYLLKSIQGQYTELTLVAMYDYRRAVSTREFPALATKLQIDLAKLVRHVTGDVMQVGDVVYDDATLAKLTEAPVPAPAPVPEPIVEHHKQEEVENNEVMLRKDPFKQEKNAATKEELEAEVKQLREQVHALEKREQALAAAAGDREADAAELERKQALLQAKTKETKTLRDSIVILNRRVEALLGQSYVADDVSVSNETADELQRLERENERLQKESGRVKKENDSLYRAGKELAAQLARLNAGGNAATQDVAALTAENERLRNELAARKASTSGSGSDATTDSLLQVLARVREDNQTLALENERQNRSIGRMQQDSDELNGKRKQLEERIASLEAEVRTVREGQGAAVQMHDQQFVDSLVGEVHAMRRSAGIAKAEATQVRSDMATLQAAKDLQEQRLVAAEMERDNLQARLDALGAGNPTPAGTPKSSDAALQDSLRLLQSRLNLAQQRAAEAADAKAALQAAQAQALTRDRELRAAQSQLEEKSAQLAEAQKSKAALQKSLNEANAQLSNAQNSSGNSQQELARLQQQNKQLTGDLAARDQQMGKLSAENQTLSDSISAARSDRARLRSDVEGRDRNLRQQIAQRDSLQSQLAVAAHRENDLQRSATALQARLDSLARTRVPETEQSQFIKEQRAKLDQQEKDLNARDQSAADRDKLLAQRESVIAKKEADQAANEARFKDLEAREKRLQLLEQQLNTKEGLATAEATPMQMREGKVNEYGNTVPVYIVETALSTKALQRQVVGYMLSRDALYTSAFPELFYRDVRLSELDTEPLEIKFRIDAKGTGSVISVSVRLSNDQYLSNENYRERQDAVKQLISKVLRYRI